jgi:outer membrane protein OmpA-like peptidoglycan-associated protein
MKHIIILFALLVSFPALSQTFQGIKQSDYGGMISTDLQPASIVDSRFKFDLTLGAFSVDVYNTYLGVEGSLFSIPDMIDDPGWAQNATLEFNEKDKNSVILINEINLPSFMFELNDQTSLGFSWKIRSIFNIDGAEAELSKLAKEGFDYSTLWNQNFTNEFLSIQTMSWAEYGVNFGQVLMDDNEHFIKVGGRLKLIQGLQAAYLYAEDLEYNFSTDDTLSLFQTEVQYGHSSNFEFNADQIKYKFISNPGIGIDIGAVYEWRPDYQEYQYDMDGKEDKWRKDLNKYKIKAGISLLDVGGVKFKKGEVSRNFTADATNWYLDPLEFQSIQDFDDTIANRFTQTADDGDFRMALPTALSAQFDYHLGKNFYVNVTTFTSFQFKNDAHKVHGYSNYSVSPRFDHQHFTLALPMSYSPMTGMRFGMAMRLGWVYFGTSNLAALAGLSSSIKGGDVYMAMKIPVFHKLEKDKDEDHVSNKYDDCPNVKGVWAFKGCPDTDNDMIPDSRDKCPAEAGLVEFNGCPDTDRDGVPDNDDDCPTVPGKKEYAGCPDTDGDGIRDSGDECPDIPGIALFNGCPDTDGDGLADKVDNCPTEAGLKENYGCPVGVKLHLVDRYGDIVASALMNQNGEFEFKNIDGEGSYMFLLEGEDPTIQNFVWITMLDKEGNSIRVQADLNSKTGYFEYVKIAAAKKDTLAFIEEPDFEIVLKKEEQELLNTAFEALEFESSKAIIVATSYESLSALVDLLKKKTEWKIKLSGHTDNVGMVSKNLMLSKKRAQAIAFYLTQRGIAEDRITVRFFGQAEPVADNETKEGRQKNRRVEMKIVK